MMTENRYFLLVSIEKRLYNMSEFVLLALSFLPQSYYHQPLIESHYDTFDFLKSKQLCIAKNMTDMAMAVAATCAHSFRA